MVPESLIFSLNLQLKTQQPQHKTSDKATSKSNHSTQNKQEESCKGNDTGLLLNHDEQVRGLATKKARRESGHIESWLRQLSGT
jgi:hypothetical protein